MRILTDSELDAHESAIESANFLGDIVDAIYGDDLRRAYVMDNHKTVIYYHYINGFWRGESYEEIADAYAAAREYGGASEDEPEEPDEPEEEPTEEEMSAFYARYPNYLLSAEDIASAGAQEPESADYDTIQVFFIYWLDSNGFAELMAVMPKIKASQTDSDLVQCFVTVGSFSSVYLSEALLMPLADIESAEVKALTSILAPLLDEPLCYITPK